MIECFKYVLYYKVQSRTRYILDLSIWYRNSSDNTVFVPRKQKQKIDPQKSRIKWKTLVLTKWAKYLISKFPPLFQYVIETVLSGESQQLRYQFPKRRFLVEVDRDLYQVKDTWESGKISIRAGRHAQYILGQCTVDFQCLLSASLNRTKVRFISLLSGGFITAVVVNQPERKLAKHNSVNWFKLVYAPFRQSNTYALYT